MTRRFPLHAVLRWREQCEAGEERALLAAQTDLRKVEAALAQVNEELAAEASRRAEKIHKVWLPSDFLAEAAHRQALLSQRAALAERQGMAEQARATRQTAYLLARQAREMLDSLKLQHDRQWRAAADAHEAKRLNDIFAARRSQSS